MLWVKSFQQYFRVSRHCYFYFCLAVGGEHDENRFAISGSLVCDGEIARRLPSTSLFPALFRIQPSYYSTFNREKETDFSRHVDFAGATNELSRDWYCEGMYVIAIDEERERDSAISDPFVRGGGSGSDGGESKISISRRW